MSETRAPASVGEPAPPSPVRLTIAICTYRRLSLLQSALAGIAKQEFGDAARPDLDVVVVDNDGDPRVGGLVEAFAAGSGIAARCVVEPSRGISHARNVALNLIAADSDFAAFIDDDEVPSPGWLQALLATQARTGAAVVCGPVLPAFAGPPAAEWIEDGGFFRQPRRPVGARIDAGDGAPVDEASTNNVLVRMAEVRRGRVRFHESFGLTGGEDVLFFRDLKALGAGIVWSRRHGSASTSRASGRPLPTLPGNTSAAATSAPPSRPWRPTAGREPSAAHGLHRQRLAGRR